MLIACAETDVLNMALADGGKIVARRPNPWSSTFPSEILTCESRSGICEILAKYSGSGGRPAFGHRGGVEYEVAVYREVLKSTPLSPPEFWGSCQTASGCVLLVEFLGEGAGIDEWPSVQEAMSAAATWAGKFHACWESRCAPAWLQNYDSEYYSKWARRTNAHAGDWHARLPWLRPLCEGAEPVFQEAAAEPRCVIHGEYVPSNVLIRNGEIKPVDWESCALGLAEVDLVSLIEGWPEEISSHCRNRYQTARWGGEATRGFDRRLDLAWLYWHLRWLGEREDWLSEEHVLGRAEPLRLTGVRLGIL